MTFDDGLGQRLRVVDPVRNEPVDMLCLRGELTSVPAFEFALRERVGRLATFRHPCYAAVHSVERLKDRSSTLALVSDSAVGVRMSEMLGVRRARAHHARHRCGPLSPAAAGPGRRDAARACA